MRCRCVILLSEQVGGLVKVYYHQFPLAKYLEKYNKTMKSV